VLAHLRNGDTYTRLAAGFGIGMATAYSYIREALELLAATATTQDQADNAYRPPGQPIPFRSGGDHANCRPTSRGSTAITPATGHPANAQWPRSRPGNY
jgi:hypothetical protein